MGNQPTNPPPGRHTYERFGPVDVQEMPDQDNSEPCALMHFTRPIESEKVYNTWAQQVTRIVDSETKETLLLPEKNCFQKSGLCGSSGIVKLTYQNFAYVLDSEIKNRKKLNRHFIETEMWYLLYNIIRAGNKFEKSNKKIGDVSPHNIVINDDGQIKVVSTCSIPGELDNFQKIIQNPLARVYLAPQQLNEEHINKCQYPSNINRNKAEVFSIGLTILSSAILEDCYEIYDIKDKKVKVNLLNRYIDQLKSHYSPYLCEIIQSMLRVDPNQRRKASEIHSELVQFQAKILDLQQFTPPPNKMDNSRNIPVQSQGRASLNPPNYLPNQPNYHHVVYYPNQTSPYQVHHQNPQKVITQEPVQGQLRYY